MHVTASGLPAGPVERAEPGRKYARSFSRCLDAAAAAVALSTRYILYNGNRVNTGMQSVPTAHHHYALRVLFPVPSNDNLTGCWSIESGRHRVGDYWMVKMPL